MVDRLFTMVKQELMRAFTKSAIATRAAMGVILMTAAACQQGSVAPLVSPTTSPSPASSALAACPATSASPAPQVLLQKQPAPDDLAFHNDGRLLFSDIKTGTVSALNADGSVERIAGGISAPEGIVVQADGRILVAEQGRNRVVAIDPQTHAVTQWHAFPNRTGRDGIDGIGPVLPSLDTQGNLLPTADNVIVPDSPNGVVWRVTADGKTATQIASGMVRPVGAAVDSSGRILVADEGGALWALTPAKVRFATLSTPDDVLVGRAGHIFVNTLGDNAIHELDSHGHQVGVITGIQQPQGIALDYADNLYYTEFNAGRIDRVIRTFVLDPPKVTRTTRGTFIICPVIRRASGFNEKLELQAGSSLKTSILQLVQPGTDSSGALEVQTPELSIGITVSDGGLLSQTQTVSLSS
jgi:sugar lactone lactonase YvrE